MPNFPLCSQGCIFCTLTLHSAIFFLDVERAVFNLHGLLAACVSFHSSALLSPMSLLSHLLLSFLFLHLFHWQHLVVKCVKCCCGINFSCNKGQIFSTKDFPAFLPAPDLCFDMIPPTWLRWPLVSKRNILSKMSRLNIANNEQLLNHLK